MGNTKYTPSPWRYSTGPQPNGCPIIGSSGLMICMLAHSVNEPKQKGTALANARLISAAPDLLEALENFIEIGCEFYDMDCGVNGSIALEQARKAIAKAKEGQP